ncbi:MAG: hypothetical protein JWO03_518 [Bacteroidetes bacterium]|nr:hypothetical protein [Bacteroidota bacterium]
MRSTIKMSAMLMVAVVLFLTGCKDPAPATQTGMLMFHLHTNLDADEVDAGDVHTNWNGKNIQLDRAQYYISGVKLIKADNSTVSVPGTILVRMGQEIYMVGNAPVGTYKSLSFNVGVQPADNHKAPATHSATDDLSEQTPTMHFASTADGYIFMAVEGMIDSSAGGTGTPDKSFSYHIGTDALLKTVTMPDHSAAPYNTSFVVSATSGATVHMMADYNKLFNTVDMSTNNITNTTDINWIATTLAGNIPNMFSYEE